MSVKIKEAAKLPDAAGVNVTLTAQVVVGVRVAPVHVSALLAKSLGFKPPSVTVEMARLTAPVLVTVSVMGALVVAGAWLGNPKTSEKKLAVATLPVPCKLTFCVLPATPPLLSVMVRVPVSGPLAVGEKVTLMVQELLAATVLPQLLVSAKLPLAVMLEMVSAPKPESLSVTGCDALVVPTV